LIKMCKPANGRKVEEEKIVIKKIK